MMTGAGFTSGVVAVLALLCSAVLHAASGEQGLDRLRLQQQMQRLSESSLEADRVSGHSADAVAQGPRGAAAQQGALLEQTRRRLEQHLKAQRELDGQFDADPDSRRRNSRFGVGYEWRMRNRQGAAPGAAGGAVGGGNGIGGGMGGSPGRGFRGGR